MTIVAVIVACAAGIAEEAEEITWCEAPETTSEEEGIICDDGPGKLGCCEGYASEVQNQCLESYGQEMCMLGYEILEEYLGYCSLTYAQDYCLFFDIDLENLGFDPIVYAYCLQRLYSQYYGICLSEYMNCMSYQYLYCNPTYDIAINYCMAN